MWLSVSSCMLPDSAWVHDDHVAAQCGVHTPLTRPPPPIHTLNYPPPPHAPHSRHLPTYTHNDVSYGM